MVAEEVLIKMKDIQLYDYQEEMRERIDATFKSYQSVMVQMPTGTGKRICWLLWYMGR